MHSLAYYALLGSLLAAAAGALVLTSVTIQHGFKRRSRLDDDSAPEEAQRRLRVVRLADSVAVACFAVAAGLGILGLMQSTSLTPRAIAAVDEGKVGERLHALEARLAGAELQIQGRTAPELRAWEERLARLETRLGAVEDRAAVAERRSIAAEQLARERRDERARTAPVAVPRRAPTITPSAPPVLLAPKPAATPPSASPRLAPQLEHQAELPSAKMDAAPPPPAVGVAPVPWPPPTVGAPPPHGMAPPPPSPPATVAVVPAPPAPTPPAPREAVRPRAEPEPSLGDKVRKDWDVIRRHVERGGEEWKDGWRQLKGLFGY